MSQEKSSELIFYVKKVQHVYRESQVNNLLKEGWILLSVASGQEQTGPNDYSPTFKYCLGKTN